LIRHQLLKAFDPPKSKGPPLEAALTLHTCRAVQPPVSASGVFGIVVVLLSVLGAVLCAGAEAVTTDSSFDALSFMEHAIALPADASKATAVSEIRSLCMAFLH
jgi:hypothetical protein